MFYAVIIHPLPRNSHRVRKPVLTSHSDIPQDAGIQHDLHFLYLRPEMDRSQMNRLTLGSWGAVEKDSSLNQRTSELLFRAYEFWLLVFHTKRLNKKT